MKILCSQEFPGDIEMLGSVAAAAPSDLEFVMLPPLSTLAGSLPLLHEVSEGADAVLTCNLWTPATIRAMFPTIPLVFLPHDACPVNAHYWLPQVLDVADLFLVPGNSLAKKTQLLKPDARIVDVPYPDLETYRLAELEAEPPDYDLVFACTSYSHYGPLIGITDDGACWHDLIPELAQRGYRVAVLRSRDDIGLVETPGVDYFDAPDARILFTGKAVISDISSEGLMAAALGRPVFQVLDAQGSMEPRLASHRGFLAEVFDIGPRYGRDWTLESLGAMVPFGQVGRDLHARYQQRVSYHINRRLAPSEFYSRLAEALVSFREPSPILA